MDCELILWTERAMIQDLRDIIIIIYESQKFKPIQIDIYNVNIIAFQKIYL